MATDCGTKLLLTFGENSATQQENDLLIRQLQKQFNFTPVYWMHEDPDRSLVPLTVILIKQGKRRAASFG
jgi:hypothetical protein